MLTRPHRLFREANFREAGWEFKAALKIAAVGAPGNIGCNQCLRAAEQLSSTPPSATSCCSCTQAIEACRVPGGRVPVSTDPEP